MDIANYIIWFAKNKFQKGITNLQLQKILYFSYVDYLNRYDKKLFREPIEKWQYGPVVPAVYHSFKDYGFFNINEPKQEFEVEFVDGKLHLNEKKFDPSFIEKDTKDLLDSVVNKWIEVPAFKMVEITHEEPMWKNYQSQILSGERSLQYSDEEIKSFYRSKKNEFFF